MAQIVAPQQTSFNAGELSPYWAGRVDMAKYGNGCYRMRNFIPIPQGPARRRPGTRFVSEGKNSIQRSWLARFIYSEDESYVLEFGDRYIRFYTNNGQLLLNATPAAWNGATAYVQGDLVSQGGINYYAIQASTNVFPPNAGYWHPLTGNIYEIPSPYSVGDLTNSADGTFRLSMDQTGDVVFIAHPIHFPRKLSRLGTNRWTITAADIKNGPFEDVDADTTTTVYASAETGAVTLTSTTTLFSPDTVDSLFLIEQKKIDGYKVWEVGKTIVAGDERRSDSNVYKALNAGTTGSVKPTHREGAKFDGDNGVQWEYLHSGYGIVRILTASGTTATGTVVSRVPSQAVGVSNATTRWAKAAWLNGTTNYPALVKIFRERLCFSRGQQVWGSVAADFENFASRDGAETLPDSAFTITIASGESNAAVWMTAQESLLVGTRGGEFSLSEVTTNDVFGPGNIKASQESGYGSRQVPPVIIGESTLFVQRSGRRMRDMRYSFNVNGYEANDLMVLSDQIANGQIIQTTFALEPASTMWACCNNGDLIALSYQLEQDVVGWHPHRIGGATGVQGKVESVVSIPAPDGTHDQVWLQVYRVIDGVPRRYIEYMERDWKASEQSLEDALFSDAGATFNGFLPGATATISGGVTWSPGEQATISTSFSIVSGDIGDYLILVSPTSLEEAKVRVDSVGGLVTFITTIPESLRGIESQNVSWARRTISGLDYLEGEEVTLTVNGAAHPREVVSSGSITLQEPASVVQVGLPADAELITMRIEGGYPNGTSQGRTKRVHKVVYRLHETLGGSAGPEGNEDEFMMRSPPDLMDEPPPAMTGDYEQPYNEGYNTDARIRVFCNQPLPFTLVAIYPQLKVDGETR